MSSCPGYTLELFLMWNYDLVVGEDAGANPSLAIAEALGTAGIARPRWAADQFAPLVAAFEDHRERVEGVLFGYDEDSHGSWRDFAGYAFDFIPDELYERGAEMVRETASS